MVVAGLNVGLISVWGFFTEGKENCGSLFSDLITLPCIVSPNIEEDEGRGKVKV